MKLVTDRSFPNAPRIADVVCDCCYATPSTFAKSSTSALTLATVLPGATAIRSTWICAMPADIERSRRMRAWCRRRRFCSATLRTVSSRVGSRQACSHHWVSIPIPSLTGERRRSAPPALQRESGMTRCALHPGQSSSVATVQRATWLPASGRARETDPSPPLREALTMLRNPKHDWAPRSASAARSSSRAPKGIGVPPLSTVRQNLRFVPRRPLPIVIKRSRIPVIVNRPGFRRGCLV